MHESTLMNGIMRRIDEVAREHHATRVTGVTLRLGELMQVSAGHLRDHFMLAAQGTVAEGAAVEIELVSDPTDPAAQQVALTRVEIAGGGVAQPSK